MVGTLNRQTHRRARAHRVQRGPTRVLRGGRTREAWRYSPSRPLYLTAAEARHMFDFQARKTFGSSGDEFLDRLDAGEYDNLTDLDEIHRFNRLIMLLPAVRSVRLDPISG